MTNSPIVFVPVVIWAEIFDWILLGRELYDPNPFYRGCNLHSALWEWHDFKRILTLERQRKILRSVCRLWKMLADGHKVQYWGGEPTYEQRHQWMLASRIHFGSSGRICLCKSPCRCYRESSLKHDVLFGDSTGTQLYQHLSQLPRNSSMSAEILDISTISWDLLCNAFSPNRLRRILPRVKALRISEVYPAIGSLEDTLPNLTYLNLYLTLSVINDIASRHLRLPCLMTLVLGADDSRCYSLFEGWHLPRLEHLQLSFRRRREENNEAAYHFLEKDWPTLQSLRLIFSDAPINLPDVFWDKVPSLKYLGLSALCLDRSQPSPPPQHPIRMIANLDEAWQEPYPKLLQLTELCPHLECFCDTHRWDDILELGPQVGNGSYERHHHDNPTNCFQCVSFIYGYCQRQGLRYEDSRGRTWNEFLAYRDKRKIEVGIRLYSCFFFPDYF